MADPRKALEILEKYYATVTPEQFKEDVRRATPQGESLHEAMMEGLEFFYECHPREPENPDDHESN
jgi:hypothetical protein